MDLLNLGTASRALPQAVTDTQDKPLRVSPYGDQHSLPIGQAKQTLADEGSYFVTTNPSPGTPIRPNAAETSFSNTRGFFVLNNAAPVNGPTVYVDYLKLILNGTAPTATVSQHFAIYLDFISREPTTAANRTVLTPVNVNPGSSRGASLKAYSYANAGAMTVPAPGGAARLVGRVDIPTGLGIAGDEYVIQFGAGDFASYMGLTAARATVPARLVSNAPPLILTPGTWAVIHRWWLTEATNAPDYEFELGHWER